LSDGYAGDFLSSYTKS